MIFKTHHHKHIKRLAQADARRTIFLKSYTPPKHKHRHSIGPFLKKPEYFCKKSFARCLPIDTLAPAKPRGVAQLASVLAWGASGRPFESDHPDKKVGNAREPIVRGLFCY